jgi:hypothetical protein
MKKNSKLVALRRRLGANSPGLTVAVAALVVALCGGAFAATGAVSSKSKSKFVTKAEATKIAKKYAGKNGANGANGAPGSPGKEGSQGKAGANGSPGANGKSVIEGASNNCAEGGVTYEIEGSGVENEVCNGEEGEPGSPWTVGGTLPVGSTETGTWSIAGTASDTSGVRASLSFPIPLAVGLNAAHVHWQEEANFEDFDGAGPETIGCVNPTTGLPSPGIPTAPSGNLCVYFGEVVENATFEGIYKIDSAKGANVSGASLLFSAPTGAVTSKGTFAVTG